MCIACELGYWSMVDALEAERNALRDKAPPAEGRFACEPGAEPDTREHPPQSVDEPAP
jgi:hypothetical protein